MAKIIKNNIANFLIICLIFVIMTAWIFSSRPQIPFTGFPPEMQKVKAAETLTNGSFTGGTTSWTLSVASYDSTTYQAGPGSVTTVTVVGRNKNATGTATHDSAISTNASDTVTLSFYWKKDYVVAEPDISTISVQIQTSGGDWSTPTTLWTDTTFGVTDWTYVSQDVSGSFDNGNYDFRLFMDLSNPNTKNAQTLAWFDTVGLDVVAGAVASVTIEDGVVEYGVVPTSGTKDTLATDLNDKQHAGNNGTGALMLEIQGQNSGNWTLSDTIGSETYKHEFSTDNGINWTALSTSFVNLDTGLADGQTQDFDLRITLPSSTIYYTSQTVDVTVQATLE